MIGKATDAGSTIGGMIEYIYEGKLAERTSANKQAEIIANSENLTMPRDQFDLIGRNNNPNLYYLTFICYYK